MMACRCGCKVTRAIEVARDGVVVAEGDLCEACFGAALDGAAEMRRQFEGLIAAGVDRRMANRIMDVRVDEHFRRAPALSGENR